MAERPTLPDYYAVLHVNPHASDIQIRRCYRKTRKTWVARANDPQAGIMLATIQEAYDMLKDPETKNYYDAEYPDIKWAWKVYQKRLIIAAHADDGNSSDDSSDFDDDDDEDLDEKVDSENDTDDGGPDGEAEDEDYYPGESSDEEIVLSLRHRDSLLVKSEDEEEAAEGKPKAPIAVRHPKRYAVPDSEDEVEVVEKKPKTVMAIRIGSRKVVFDSDDEEGAIDKKSNISIAIRRPNIKIELDSKDKEKAKATQEKFKNTMAIRRTNSKIVLDPADEIKDSSEDETDAEFTDGEEPESDDDATDESVDLYTDYTKGYAADTDEEFDDE